MSEATEVVMLIERRCAMMALALPSRSEDTVKACNCTVPPAAVPGVAAVLVRLISRTAVCPAEMVNASFTVL